MVVATVGAITIVANGGATAVAGGALGATAGTTGGMAGAAGTITGLPVYVDKQVGCVEYWYAKARKHTKSQSFTLNHSLLHWITVFYTGSQFFKIDHTETLKFRY